jgi:hypothetical protein
VLLDCYRPGWKGGRAAWATAAPRWPPPLSQSGSSASSEQGSSPFGGLARRLSATMMLPLSTGSGAEQGASPVTALGGLTRRLSSTLVAGTAAALSPLTSFISSPDERDAKAMIDPSPRRQRLAQAFAQWSEEPANVWDLHVRLYAPTFSHARAVTCGCTRLHSTTCLNGSNDRIWQVRRGGLAAAPHEPERARRVQPALGLRGRPPPPHQQGAGTSSGTPTLASRHRSLLQPWPLATTLCFNPALFCHRCLLMDPPSSPDGDRASRTSRRRTPSAPPAAWRRRRSARCPLCPRRYRRASPSSRWACAATPVRTDRAVIGSASAGKRSRRSRSTWRTPRHRARAPASRPRAVRRSLAWRSTSAACTTPPFSPPRAKPSLTRARRRWTRSNEP